MIDKHLYKLIAFGFALIPLAIGLFLINDLRIICGVTFLIWAQNISQIEYKESL